MGTVDPHRFLVVLGIGNTIRMDDGAGIRVVEELKKVKSLKNLDISFKCLNSSGIEILDEINGYKQAIIVDAASTSNQELRPGEIFHLDNLNEFKTEQTNEISSHGIGVLGIMKYAKKGGHNLPNPIEVYGIQIKETNSFIEDLTPEVSKAVKELVIILKDRILKLFSTNF